MAIRDATASDVPQLCGLISDFYGESKYVAPVIDPDKTAFVLRFMIERISDDLFFKVIERDGRVVGLLIAERLPDLWSHAEKAVEQIMYVTPGYRGTASAGKLLIEFARWSQIRPAVVRVEASSGVDNDKAAAVFAKLGWEPRGTLHGMEAY